MINNIVTSLHSYTTFNGQYYMTSASSHMTNALSHMTSKGMYTIELTIHVQILSYATKQAIMRTLYNHSHWTNELNKGEVYNYIHNNDSKQTRTSAVTVAKTITHSRYCTGETAPSV